MKNLRFFGLLVTVLLLAFGLTVGCSNGSTDEDSTEPVETTYTGKTASGQQVEILFSNKTIPAARARAAGEPNQGDNYQIKVDGREVSRGTIELLANGNIKFIPDDGPEFFGNLNNGILQVSGDNIGGSALSVNATPAGSTNVPGGVGGGGAGGGGGTSGPGASGTPPTTPSVTPTAETPKIAFTVNPPVITYTAAAIPAVAAGAANTAATTTGFLLTFDVPAGLVLDGLNLNEIAISNDTGIVNTSGAEILATGGNTYTISGIQTYKQGLVNLSVVNKKNVDLVQKKVPVYVVNEAEVVMAANAFALQTSAPATTAATGYFTTEAVSLLITVPSNTNLNYNNIGWFCPTVNLGGNTTTAEIQVYNFRNLSATTYGASVNVISQGEVYFFLRGVESGTNIELDPTLFQTFATKDEPIRYNVYRYSGPTGGASNQVTTTQLRFEFEYDPLTALDSFVWNTWVTSNLSNSGYGNPVGAWPLTSAANAAGNTARERIVELDSAEVVNATQGFVRFSNTLAGIETSGKVVQVFRKAKSRYTVNSLETLGITTHLEIIFDPATTDGTEFGTLAIGDILVTTRKGTIIQDNTQTNAQGAFMTVTPAGAAYETIAVDTSENPAGPNRYILKLAYPVTPEDIGPAVVDIYVNGNHPDVEQYSTVNLAHNGYSTTVTVTHADIASGDTAVALTVNFSPALVPDPRYDSRVTASSVLDHETATGAPVFTAFSVGSTGLTPPTVSVASPVQLTAAGSTAGTGYTYSWTGHTAGRLEDANGTTFSNLSITFGRPNTKNYINYFIDPRAVIFPLTFYKTP